MIAYFMPFMTLIEFGEVESSINDFQLLWSEKLFNTLSQKLLHCAASIGSSASLILSSRFHAQNTIKNITNSVQLKMAKYYFLNKTNRL
jgi:hypothetical protein